MASLTAFPGEPESRSRGFAQIFGLHFMVAFLVVLIDAMTYGEEGLAALLTPFTAGVSAAFSIVFSCVVGGVLGVIVYLAQRKWYGDDKDSALIKALAIGLLTALPFPLPLPAMLSVPAGAIGWFGGRKKEEREIES